jgi:hypothetical protein
MEMSSFRMKKLYKSVLLAFIILAWASPVIAQSEISLNLGKTFGYNNGSQIRGTFAMSIRGDVELKSVTFLMDGKPIQQVSAAPFIFSFNTTSFTDGWHDLSATALTADGRTLTTNVVRIQFVSAAEEQTGMSGILLPILGLVALIILGTAAMQFGVFHGGKHVDIPLGTERNYGVTGGAVCPRCGRPFQLHWWTPHLLNGKFETCPSCGRRGLFYRASLDALRQAETAELNAAQPAQPVHEQSQEEKLRQQLDDSRYDDQG